MPSPIQLDIFVDRPSRNDRTHFDILALGGANGWILRSWIGVAGLTLQAEPRGRSCLYSNPIDVRIDLGPDDPQIAGLGNHVYWEMTRTLPRRRSAARDVFNVILDRTVASAEVWDCASSDDRSRLQRWLNALAGRLVDCCQPGALRIALRFRGDVRFGVYAEIVRDHTARMEQLAAVCPGAVAIVAAARGNPALIGTVARFREAVARGRRLDGMVDDLVEGCAQADGMGALPPAVRTRWRLLIRKAGPAVAPAHLMMPPPLAFIAEDIPADGSLQVRWFKVMAREAAWRSMVAAPSRLACAFSAFVARNALKLTDGRGDLVPSAAQWLEALGARRILPDRRAAPDRLAEVVRQHMWMRDLQGLEPAVKHRLLRTGDGPLPAPPFPDWTAGENAVVAIRTVQDLLREGRAMGHCVGGFADVALAGESFFFSARLPIGRLTLQLEAVGESFVLMGIRGRANRLPTRRERRALEPWLAHVRQHRPLRVADISERADLIALMDDMRQTLASLVIPRRPATRPAAGLLAGPALRR